MREQFVVQHKIKQKSYRDYLSIEEVGKELNILHREVAGAEAVFFHHGKAIVIQGSSAPSQRGSSSRRGRQNAGNVIPDAAGPTHKTDHPDGGNKQGQYRGHDGQNECPHCIECHQANAPTGQGEHSSGQQRQTPWRRRSSEEAQEEKDAMPQL